MEAALLSGFIKVIVPKLLSVATEKYKLNKELKDDIKFLVKELRMIVGAIDDELSSQPGDQGAVMRLSMEELHELAHGIEDSIDGVFYQASKEQRSSALGRTIRTPKKLQANLQLAKGMKQLRKLAEEASQRRQRYTVVPVPPHGQSSTATDESTDPRILDSSQLLGVDTLRVKILEQLAEAAKGQLRVISIVGFSGSGKTALAAAVYNQETQGERFDKHAWVCATHKGPRELLVDILRKLTCESDASSSTKGSVAVDASAIGQLCVDLRKQLRNKRYFIVIDDIRKEDHWKTIQPAFPVEEGVSSRMVVTTTIQSVAKTCSSSEGYVHKMSRLDRCCSEKLFSMKACPGGYLTYDPPDSAAILKKCDGQPLALVTIGEFMRTKGWPSGRNCEAICNRLNYHLENDTIFERMRKVLIRNYTSLPGHALKACLLYFGMFPCDHPIKKKRLLRRWLAEGFVEQVPSHGTPDPAAAFDVLMDRNIILPINVSSNDNVKTCQTYGMMHEFILHMSISQNFVTSICDEEFQHRYVRRLSLQGNTTTDDRMLESIDLPLVRSLTIFGEASDNVLDFKKYKLLRVLDLEMCNNLKDDHLKDICNLLLMKYLSLGGEVKKIPRGIAKLKDLEALDVRRTKVEVIPVEVFQLPSLIHLFGKFKISGTVKQMSEVKEFISDGKSKLQTLAGFSTDESEGFMNLIGCMNKLRKVKIWCESSADSTDWSGHKEAIQQFIKDEKEATIGTRSLSLHFNKCSEDFLNSLEGPCYLSSLKLHGQFPVLPQFILLLRGLKELCLSSTKLTTVLLEALSNLSYLQYLKLVADDLGKFIIKDQAFPRLLSLCIVLQRPTFPTIEQGALPFLVTLQLLCKDLHGLSDIKIEHLTHLQEVILHPKVAPETRKEWVKAANAHPNRPNVPEDDSIVSELGKSEATENCIVSEAPVKDTDNQMHVHQGPGSFSMPNKQNNNCTGESSSHQSCTFTDIENSVVSPTLNELPNSLVSSYT